MKQETKKLIEWMKIQLGLLRTNTNEIINNSVDKSITFLDSLPEIESKLCRGGYIQDKNGTPCCDGDKILFCGEYNGFLRFGFLDDNDKKYTVIPHFWFDFGGVVPTISGSVYFEKVE
jgi:hypothetical protein